MYEPLDTWHLPTGRSVEIGVLTAPDPADLYGVLDLLGHKGQPWQWHLEEALAGRVDELETRHYLASLDDLAVAQVMTLEYRGVGILGHVFTRPEERRQGLCAAIFRQLLPDFRARGGLRLTLGTGYDSPAYHIYHSCGFRSVVPETGFMKLETGPDFLDRWFAAAPAEVVEPAWRHWPTLAQLLAEDWGDGLRSVVLGQHGPANFEGGYLHLLHALANDRGPTVRLLETAAGAVVGWAVQQPDSRWQGRVELVDLFCHPAWEADLPRLLAALPGTGRPRQAWVPAAATARLAAFAAAGFRPLGGAALLPGGGDCCWLEQRP
ncbi:MAG: GNAT family N-acetyltransferase [Fimbriimonadaceae bacterium]|nr:GNAT family N-acetyltransferase [Fimbriimonadaceae bacterium]